MTEQIRTREQLLEQLFPDGQLQDITAQKIRDFVVSVTQVGAGDSTSTVADGTSSGLTKIGARRFLVNTDGDGQYMFFGLGDADIDIEADLTAQFLVNNQTDTSNYVAVRRFRPGQQSDNSIIVIDLPARSGWDGTGDRLIAGDEIKLVFVPSGGANLSNINYFIFGIRV